MFEQTRAVQASSVQTHQAEKQQNCPTGEASGSQASPMSLQVKLPSSG